MLPALCLAGWDMPLQNLCFQGFEWAYGRIWVTSLGDNRCLFYSSCDVRGREMWGRQTRYKETIQGLLWGINKCHACVYSVCVLQTKRWAPGLDSSCNYQSKLRSFSRMFDTTRRSSLPWRSHFLRNLSCSFSRKTTSSLWRGRNRRKERDGPCDVVKKPMNCIGRLTLKTKRACANTFVITDRHMAETQTCKPNAHTCTHTHWQVRMRRHLSQRENTQPYTDRVICWHGNSERTTDTVHTDHSTRSTELSATEIL